MTDNNWNTEPTGSRHGDDPAAAEPTSRFELPATDSTERMPHHLQQSSPDQAQPPPGVPGAPHSHAGPGPTPNPGSAGDPVGWFAPPAGSPIQPAMPASLDMAPGLPDSPGGSGSTQPNGSSPSAPPGRLGAPAPPAGRPPDQQLPPSVKAAGWSPLGSTPSAPPVRSVPQAGPARYLPPVAPPQIAATPVVQPNKPSKSGSSWGWRAFVSFLAGGLIAAAGFGAAQLSAETETTAAVAPTTVLAPTTTSSTIPRSTGSSSGTVPLAPLDVDEPAAFVAKTLGPAVVQIETSLGLGSGVIFGDGLILTNNHVVGGAETVRVKLSTGRVLSAEIVGTDVNTDVAVVTVGLEQNLPIAQLATGQKAQVGQIAIAIGSPFDLQQSVTAGIVSAVDRPIQNNEQSVVAMIQTDAPINPGNSGGALADRRGRVIGINTSIQTDGLTAANVGVGFAIPIDTAIRIADLLVAGAPIQPGFLGVRGEEPPGGEVGVRLTEVTVGSAAELAGLRVGDRVLSVDGAPVTEFPELAGLVLANQAGDTVSLEVIRNGQPVSIDVTLGLREGN